MSDEAVSPRRRIWLAILPAAVFAGLALIFWQGLSGDPSKVPSALINKPIPEFNLPAVEGLGIPGLSSSDLKMGQVAIVNVWASWCGPCRTEHPLLMELAGRSDIRLVGINYKDDAENARRFLGSLGQPFAAVGADQMGRSAVDWGVYGVPETFVVDGKGTIRYKSIGPLTPEIVATKLNDEIRKAAAN
jgi:cytochrome c biogenesis protein CcmG/thiol:disulfide interchange protein DsbE